MKFVCLWRQCRAWIKFTYPMKVLLQWRCFSNEGASPMKVLHQWRCFSNEGASPMKVLLQWRYRSNEGASPMKVSPRIFSLLQTVHPLTGNYSWRTLCFYASSAEKYFEGHFQPWLCEQTVAMTVYCMLVCFTSLYLSSIMHFSVKVSSKPAIQASKLEVSLSGCKVSVLL